jgi:hypothetical protein
MKDILTRLPTQRNSQIEESASAPLDTMCNPKSYRAVNLCCLL